MLYTAVARSALGEDYFQLEFSLPAEQQAGLRLDGFRVPAIFAAHDLLSLSDVCDITYAGAQTETINRTPDRIGRIPSSAACFMARVLVARPNGMMMEVPYKKGIRERHELNGIYAVTYVVAGALRTQIGGSTVELTPGDMVVHLPGAIHEDEALDDATVLEVRYPMSPKP
jgi:quercetin dioxygenase-like cupin family protein